MPSRNHDRNRIERSIRALEDLLQVSITVIDRDGVFHSPEGLSLLDYNRQSHKKNPVCAHGFSDIACVGHCRHEMNARGAEEGQPFVHTCWKGVQEVVVPLIRNGIHFGSLYAGIWRQRGTLRPPTGEPLPDEAIEAYGRLPELDEDQAHLIGTMLATFAQGMLSQLDEAVILDARPESRKAEIRRYIRYNAARRIALADLADELHLSASRTSHAVRDLFGKSFRELLRDERIQRAKYLLQSTDYPVGQIARQVGMPDEYHFNRTFKASVGTPPGRFRKQTSTQPYH
jgi:AraC-like DNA-binding protein